MVGDVSLNPSGGNFIFADFETDRCQFCTKMPEMLDLCYLEKNSTVVGLSPEPPQMLVDKYVDQKLLAAMLTSVQ